MRHIISDTSRSYLKTIVQFIISAFVLTLCAITVPAQSAIDGMTPSGMAPGGSLDSVNYYNGDHSFRLPLLQIGGRGSGQIPLLMQVEQHWRADGFTDPANGINRYGANPNWWTRFKMIYEPGYMVQRITGRPDPQGPCDLGGPTEGMYFNTDTLTRLTFTGADGTEHDFVDQQTLGQIISRSYCLANSPGPYSRGKVFVTLDGSGATFISDSVIFDNTDPQYNGEVGLPTGVVFFRDGTEYRIDDGQISWIRDRNGNEIHYTYQVVSDPDLFQASRVVKIVDSLNREIDIQYDVNDVAPYGLCDHITYKGFGGAARTIRISKTTLANALRTTQSSDSTVSLPYDQLFPYLNDDNGTYYGIPNPDPTYNPTVRNAVWLPNGQHYQLYYNPYAELARVEYPSGGATEYDIADAQAPIPPPLHPYDSWIALYRRVQAERTYVDGTTLTSNMTLAFPDGTDSIVTVDHWDPIGNRLAREKHYFYGSAASSLGNAAYPYGDPLSFNSWKEGREYQTESYDFDGTTVLQRTNDTWQQGGTYPWASTYPWTYWTADMFPQYNLRVIEHDVNLVPTNQISKTVYTYDQYNNVTSTAEYDFGTGAPGALLRSSQTTYLTTNSVNGISYDTILPNTTSPSTTSSVHIRNLPSQTSVFDASGTECARTTYEYDNYAASSNHAALVNRSNITGLDSNFTTSKTTRGNATALSRYILPAATAVTSYSQYDIAGNVVNASDPNGNSLSFGFTDNYGAPNGSVSNDTSTPTEITAHSTFAFPTQITNALSQTAQVQYDYYLGRPVDSQDVNSIVTSTVYDDPLDRQTQSIANASDIGSTGKSQTTAVYDDANNKVTDTIDLTNFNDNALKTVEIYDGFHRTIETRKYETSVGYITTTQTFDALGRKKRVSNPYRSQSEDTYGYTESTYDALSRLTSVQTFDKNGSSTGTVYSYFNGAQSLLKDQAGNQKLSQTNAIGQMTAIWEITSADSATVSISFPGHSDVAAGYKTTYQYDSLDDLTQVTQQIGTSGTTQTRTFAYNSLKRLTSATNPESSTISYSYDNNGNLTGKTDAIGNVTSISYDALNRVTSKSYSVTSPTVSTSTVTYKYDSQTLPFSPTGYSVGASIGKLTAVTSTIGGSTGGNVYGYDAIGRESQFFQRTDSVDYKTAIQNYNLAGQPTSINYPSSRSVTLTYDGAARIASLSSSGTNGSASTGSVTYAPQGGLSSETYGNTLYHSFEYNSRLQPTRIKLGTNSSTPANWLDLTFTYGTTDNNGNIHAQTIGVGTSNYSQSYVYDTLNRLTSAQEATGGSTSWSQSFSYDRFGNRTVGSSTSGLGTYYSSPSIDAASNRFVTTGGAFAYDAAGNLTTESTGSGSLSHRYYTYDAENHITHSKVDATDLGDYVYDGEGHRVKKVTADNLRMIYDSQGQLIAEYDLTGNLKKEYVYGVNGLLATVEPTVGTQYITSDHLGSPRLISNSNGTLTVVGRHDYAPFGEEIPGTIGGRSSTTGYPPNDNLRPKFTSKERDSETGLDYFKARYSTSSLGRFTSPDPLMASGRTGTPQSWNRYVYVINNPLNLTDPTGLIWVYQYSDREQSKIWVKWVDGNKAPPGWHPLDFGASTTMFLKYADRDGGLLLNKNSSLAHEQTTIKGDDGSSFRNAMRGFGDAMIPFGSHLRRMLGVYADENSDDYKTANAIGTGVAIGGHLGITAYEVASASGTTVYRAVDEATGEVSYVGITNNFVRRMAEHMRIFRRVNPIEGLEDLSRYDARNVEEALIDFHKLKPTGTLQNIRHSISDLNPFYEHRLQKGYDILRSVGYPGID